MAAFARLFLIKNKKEKKKRTNYQRPTFPYNRASLVAKLTLIKILQSL